MEKALKPGYDGNVLFLLAAVQQSQTSIVWDANHLSLKIAVEGTSESAVQMNLDFWKSILHEDDFRALGIELHSSQIKEKGFVIMKMDQQKIPLPPIVYKFTLAVVATRAVLKQLEAGEGAQVRIKWDGHEVWNGVLHPKLNMQIVLALLHFTMLPLLEGREVRLVGMAKQLFNIDVEEVAQFFKHRPIRLHMMVEVHGGGPTKENQKVFVRNSLASTLLEQGFDIKMVSSTVDTIMQKAGMKPAAQVAHLPAGKQRLDRLLQLCRDTEIALPNKVITGAANVAQVNAINKTKRKVMIQPNPEEYVIQDGFLCNEDGTPIPQIGDITAKATGIILTSIEKAKPWLREGQLISPDELGVAVIGKEVGDSALQSIPVNIPCLDKDNRAVILSCQLYQLGEKKVTTVKNATQPVVHEPCEIVAMTLWKQDWETKDWDAIVDQTTNFLRQVWEKCGVDNAILSIWGKSMRHNRQPTTAMHASSVQVHCTVQK